MERFWALKGNHAAAWRREHMTNELHFDFRWRNEPSKKRLSVDKGTVFLDNGNDKIRVPKIGLLSLQKLHYTDVARWIFEANAMDMLDAKAEKVIQDVWKGIITHLYPHVFDVGSKYPEVRYPSSRKLWATYD